VECGLLEYEVGLTCGEREGLNFHPEVRFIRPFEPRFDMAMVFD
jgi:hypothetical protein